MPSSTSSSEPGRVDAPAFQRPLPALRCGVATLVALALFVGGLAAWEAYWRAYGAVPGYVNSDGLWAMQRRRIDQGEGDRTVIIGSSRVLFDIQLDVWERLSGERPIQLAVEGTSPLFALEDLAEDPDFAGRLIVGVTPPLFFTGFALRANVLDHYRRETPSQRIGQWLSMHLLEPWLAFLDPDFALFRVLERQHWPPRPGVPVIPEVRKLAVGDIDRGTRMWHKLENDPAYQAIAKDTWRRMILAEPPPPPDVARKALEAQLARAAAAVAKLRARGVPVVFVRAPSDGAFYAAESAGFPRERTWDVLLERTGAPGVHFEDHADMQGLTLAEWSHLTGADADRYTEALYRAVEALDAVAPAGD